jgi:hypothetical protein
VVPVIINLYVTLIEPQGTKIFGQTLVWSFYEVVFGQEYVLDRRRDWWSKMAAEGHYLVSLLMDISF